MAGVSMGTGLTSGIDYTTMISQLMQIEAQPQTQLKNQLAGTKTDAAAYRDINSAFAALGTAAQALMNSTTWGSVKAASSSTGITASATAGAQPGTVSFTVDALATNHTIYTGKNWTATTDDFGLGSPLTFTNLKDNSTFGIPLADTDGNGTVSLAEAVSSINGAGKGITATAVNTGSGYRLQLTTTTSGVAGKFDVSSASMPAGTFTPLTVGVDAQITVGGTGGYQVTSPSNTFSGVMDGASFTVSQTTGTTPVTVSVTSNPDAVASAVQAFVDAANTVINRIGSYTDSSSSTAPLKGDYSLTSLAGQILDQVSSAVGGTSAAVAGLQLTKTGAIAFDASVFKSKLTSDPALVQKIFGGTTLVGADNVANTPDDQVDVDGLGARIAVLADRASDSATGILTSLANGQDTRAKDLQDQIDAWDLRLQQRKDTLTAQFNAMETALGTLQNQSTWLTSQIASLPSWTTNSSK
jgi:flagellar hook-associated protein 2